MRRDLLILLRDKLDSIPPDKQYKYYHGNWSNMPEAVTYENCKTAGCAAGWACGIPEIAQAGLKIEYTAYSGTYVPTYQAVECLQALSLFFEISMKDADNIFGLSYYDLVDSSADVTPKMVSNRITELLNRY